jgi:hypothetical protein
VLVNQLGHVHLQQKRNDDRDIVNSLADCIDLFWHSASIAQFSKSQKRSREPSALKDKMKESLKPAEEKPAEQPKPEKPKGSK